MRLGFAVLALCAVLAIRAHATDPMKGYLPAQGKDVSETHPDRKALQKLAKDFVHSLEGRNLKLYKASVTEKFDRELGLSRKWSKVRVQDNPGLIEVRDLLLMDYKPNSNLYMRFTVHNLATKKETGLNHHSWYVVKKNAKTGKWLIDAFEAGFDPDAGP
jgi:hypothetical protein